MLSPRKLLSPTRVSTIVLLLSFAGSFSSPSRALPSPKSGATDPASGVTIAVADFTGSDKELGRFIAETLLTDLAQSQQLNLVERTEIRQALTELKLQSTGLVEPQNVKQLGKLIGADRLIVGSFFLHDDEVFVNARLLDVKTGRVSPGGSANVSGNRNELLTLTHRLARQFHKRVTGADLDLDGSASIEPVSEPVVEPKPASLNPPKKQDEPERIEPTDHGGLIPAHAHPNAALAERDLAGLVSRLAQQTSAQTESPVTLTRSSGPVTRLRVLTAFVKLFVSPENLPMYTGEASEMPPDASRIPSWGKPYVAAAMQHDWWPADRPLRAREDATWAFVTAILERMPIAGQIAPQSRTADDSKGEPDACTGLIVDLGGMRLERDMNLRILDEDGQVVYPDPAHIPSYNYLLDNGMASYCTSIHESRRAGDNPLIVRAIGVGGPGHDDVIVSNATADRIREANRYGRFLWRWSVCVLCLSNRRTYTRDFPGYD